MVMFKVPTKVEGARVPDVPDTAFNSCHCAWTDCTTEYSFVFAIITDEVNEGELATSLQVIPLTQEEEKRFAGSIEIAQNETDYLNGVKERPKTEWI